MKDYSLLSFALRGARRKKVLLCLNKPKIPKEIALECKISIHNISKTLKELLDKKLIVCKNPEDKFFRFYELNKKGKQLVKELPI